MMRKGMPGSFADVSVVMATRDEEAAVAGTIEDIRRAVQGEAEILIVDGSADRTPEIAEETGVRVIRQAPAGYGVALREGLLAAKGKIIVTMDCDDTYPAEAIPELVLRVREGYDVAGGSRLMQDNPAMKGFNRFGNLLLSRLASALYGAHISDVTTGMRAYRREIIHGTTWTENTGLSAELLIRPIQQGCRVTEIPISYRARKGTTKLRPIRGGLSILKSIIKCRF